MLENEYYRLSMQQLCNLLGVSASSIRKYDKYNAIRTLREENGYRIYGYNGIQQCIKMRSFSSMGFSINESGKLSKNADYEYIHKALENKIPEYDQKLRIIQKEKEYVENLISNFDILKKYDGNLIETISPGMYWLQCRSNYRISDDPKNRESIQRWADMFPIADSVPIIRQNSVPGAGVPDLGYGILDRYSEFLTIDDLKASIHINPQQCFMTVLHANHETGDFRSVYLPVLSEIKDRGYELSGDIISVLVASDMKTPWRNDDFYDYYITYFPVKK